ncbi:MAG: hypothetical protein IJS93_01935 [Clostridia bacterium]|nr:hypothetical protein [Clostridia bacterium]
MSFSVEPSGNVILIIRLYSLKLFSLVREPTGLTKLSKKAFESKKLTPKARKLLVKLALKIKPTLFLTLVDELDPFKVAILNGLGTILKNYFGKVIVKTYSSRRPTVLINCLLNFSLLQVLSAVFSHTNGKE